MTDDQAEVVAGGRDELLHERAVTAEPPTTPELLEAVLQLGSRVAPDDVATAASEAGLDDNRQGELGHGRAVIDVRRPRVGNA